ncbi:ORF6N domain-containing protein [Anaerotignum sp.]|uniref:ORF6N domain-containing protein n=1 Tax=Anaerotignum sp. TaxID=2039241 RepID=UPI003318F431
MEELIVNGTQNFMGRPIPVVSGGFGQGKKCMSDKTIAEIHGVKVIHVRELIGRNFQRFKEGVDFVDLKVIVQNDNNLFTQLGYSQMQISKAEHIYILSERGYSKLIKIMDTDLAWKIHDKLMDEYFEMRDEKQSAQKEVSSQSQKKLASVNNAAKIIMPHLIEAGVDPIQRTYFLKDMYAPVGINVPMIRVEQEKLYEQTEMAEILGVYSKSGKPHAQAIGAIISKLNISESDIVQTSYSRNGHTDISNQYKEPVLQQVEKWFMDNGYPTAISKGTKEFKVNYR